MENKELNTFLPLWICPNLAWIKQYIDCEKPSIVNEKSFPKQTFRNHLDYGTFQGIKSFSVPLIKESRIGDYQNVRIDYSTNWDKQFFNALKTSYNKSPFFEYYDYQIEAILKEKNIHLWDLNLAFLNLILKALRISKTYSIEESSSLIIEQPKDIPLLHYYQVFEDKQPFLPNLSALDLVFNEGINAPDILKKLLF